MYRELDENSISQSLDTMQPVLETFSALHNILLKFVSCSGKHILKPKHKLQSNFCRLIRSHPDGLHRCYDSTGHRAHLDPNKPHLLTCHAGLFVLVVPLQGERGVIGALAAGGIRAYSSNPSEGRVLIERLRDLDLDEEKLLKYYEEIPTKTHSEIMLLGKAIHAISNCLLELGAAMEKIKEAEMEKALAESELRALSSQINPHFLFNTLNIIQMISYLEGANQTTDLINALANLLRARLSVNSLFTILLDELEVINNLLVIQKVRFEDRLQVSIVIPDDLLELQLPTLSLQPLIENALVHGLEPLEGKGRLELLATVKETDVVFLVKDNGVGMTAYKLAKIRNQLVSKQTRDRDNAGEIGLVNIHQRCQACFGKKYGLEIYSKKNKGTEVYLRIPLIIKGCELNENLAR